MYKTIVSSSKIRLFVEGKKQEIIKILEKK